MENNLESIFFTHKILEWVSLNLKDYPWRKERSLYRCLVSEFFLQRTKADQVKRVYEEFITKFPNQKKLLSITKDELNYFFKQLGLLKRVEYFWKIIVLLRNNNKELHEYNELEMSKFPGVGHYTLNAILCFGKNVRVPLIDSNIIRILTRFFHYQSNKIPKTDPNLWQLAEDLLPNENYVEYNYGLIDFGAEVCTPKNPKCDICPLKNNCSFYYNLKKSNYQ